MDETDIQILDAIMERPHPFEIDGTVFYVYPMTLGKKFIVQRLTEQLKIDGGNVQRNVNLEFLRVVKAHKDTCCELMAYLTARNEYYAVFDVTAFKERKEVFSELSDEELATFMIIALTSDKTDAFIKHLGIDKEQADMKKVMDVKMKSDKNTFTFGGMSIYGSILDVAMERYKMTKRQVVWEIDYTSLRMLLADKVNSIYVSDEERKQIHIPRDRSRIDGDNKEALMNAIKSQSWD